MPPWCRSKCRSAGVMVPRRSCSGVRDDVELGSRRGSTKGERSPRSLGSGPGRRVVSMACCAAAGTAAAPTAPAVPASTSRRVRPVCRGRDESADRSRCAMAEPPPLSAVCSQPARRAVWPRAAPLCAADSRPAPRAVPAQTDAALSTVIRGAPGRYGRGPAPACVVRRYYDALRSWGGPGGAGEPNRQSAPWNGGDCRRTSPPIVAFGSAGRPTNPARSLHRSTAQTPRQWGRRATVAPR